MAVSTAASAAMATSLLRAGPITAAISFRNPKILSKTLASPILRFRLKSPPSPLRSSAPSVDAASVDSDEDYADEEDEVDEEEVVVEEVKEVSLPRAVTSPSGEPGRLYVGNLPFSMTSAQLSEIFSQAGTVKSAEIVYNRVTDRSRGFAFVTMATTEDAKKAILMFEGSQLEGRTVKVNFPEVPRGGEREVMGPLTRLMSRGYVESPHKVYAGNLGWTVTSEILKDAFITQPGILGAKVIYERDSGRSKGYGFVSFSTAEDAHNAIEAMNGKEVEGRPLRLNLASERFSSATTVPTQEVEAVKTAHHPLESSIA